MKTSSDPYEVLEVPTDVGSDALRTAYRKAVKTAHPDRGGNPEDFRQIQWAWELLSDESARRAWDSGVRPASIDDEVYEADEASSSDTPHPGYQQGRPAWAGSHRRASSQNQWRKSAEQIAFERAVEIMQVWVHNRVLYTHGFAKIVSHTVLGDSAAMVNAIADLDEDQKKQLVDLTCTYWNDKVAELRTEVASTGRDARMGIWAVMFARRPAGSFPTRMLAVFWALVVATAMTSVASLSPGIGDSSSQAANIAAGVAALLVVPAALFTWAPTWVLSAVRYRWGARPRNYALLAGLSTAVASAPLAVVWPVWSVVMVVLVALVTAAGWFLGTRRDRSWTEEFPPAPPRVKRFRKDISEALRRQRVARRQRRKTRVG